MWFYSFLSFYTLIFYTYSEKCTTPNGETANCISLLSCPILIKALATEHPTSMDFVRKSFCGCTTNEPLVCCGTHGNFTNVPIENRQSSLTNEEKIKLLPSKRACGYQHSDDYYHSTSSNTSFIDEFPWLAVLRYEPKLEGKSRRTVCSGSLINNRYVLTAAHCINISTRHVASVRLGEYNVEQEEDCIENGQETECTDPVSDFGIENVIIHKNFSYEYKRYDIALIRLNRTVRYSDYIRPICLPLPGTKLAQVGDLLVQSGWGSLNFTGEAAAKEKKKVVSELLQDEKCKLYTVKNFNYTEYFTCTNVTSANTYAICSGDSGGPLMFSHRNQWHQEGIIAYGYACNIGRPDVNIKVAYFVDWILENIQP